jgi:predicted nucleic acid-binding protein
MIVVSDTTAISGLIQIGRVELLQELFGDVHIPEAVRDELLHSHHTLPAFLQIDAVANRVEVTRLERELDLGEAEAIVLARELRADVLLMDEKIGRRVAQREGVPIIGLMGVLVAGKRRGFVPSVRVVVGELESKAGFRVSARVKQMVFTQAGE